jgi:hypothetical protein
VVNVAEGKTEKEILADLNLTVFNFLFRKQQGDPPTPSLSNLNRYAGSRPEQTYVSILKEKYQKHAPISFS